MAAAERLQHDKECLEGIEEAKGVAARWESGGGVSWGGLRWEGRGKDDPPVRLLEPQGISPRGLKRSNKRI